MRKNVVRTTLVEGSSGVAKLDGSPIQSLNLVFRNVGDCILPMRTRSFLSQRVFLDRCNKNFVYYCANSYWFPEATVVYINSHPCDASVLEYRLGSETFIYLHEQWARYKKRWAPNYSNVIVIDEEQYEKEMELCFAHPKEVQFIE